MFKFLIVAVGVICCSSVYAMTNYEISKSNCIAWSEAVKRSDFAYSFSPAVGYGGGLQVSFMAHHLKGSSQDHIDTVTKSKVNGKMISFAVQGHGSIIVFRPQDKQDTRYILDAATTGSLSFDGMVFKTGGTKRVVNHMLSNCTD